MNIRTLFAALSIMPLLAGGASAGDSEKGEKSFKRCKSCHMITADDGTKIVKGGKTGPNLYGLIGRTVGSLDGYKYSKAFIAASEAGIVWNEENLAKYVTDPKAWLVEVLDDKSAKGKMTFKLKKGSDDMAAYLATLGGS